MPSTLRILAHGNIIEACLVSPDGHQAGAARAEMAVDSCGDAVAEIFALLSAIRGEAITRVELAVPPDDHLADSPGPLPGVIAIGLLSRPLERITLPKLALTGTIDATGSQVEPLDETRLLSDLPALVADHRLRALSVSGINSMINPLHERRAAELARACTGVPVFEARYLIGENDAIQRAILGAASMRRLLTLRELAIAVRELLIRGGVRPPPFEVAQVDDALVAAVTSSDAAAGLAGGIALHIAEVVVRARVTRPQQGCYACHCDDARFEFESITEAKSFGDMHVRELALERAARGALPEPVTSVACEDAYTEIRGKKGPVRVYLETRITATARSTATGRELAPGSSY